MASTHLTRSITSTNTSWTLSVWVKRGTITSTQYMMSWGGSGTENGIGFSSSDKFQYYSAATGSNPSSSALYRDTNGFYHFVVRNNAGTITIYVNGEAITMTGGTSGSALNSSTMRIGDWTSGQYHFDGIMSHLHFIDGTAYAASTFGSTDAATGEWKINTNPTVTYGSDGFFILKDGNSVTDASPNTNNFTVAGGTLTKTEDNPSNVFATMNFLNVPTSNLPTFSNGNTTTVSSTNGSGRFGGSSTLGMVSGKFYIEAKATVDSQYSRNVIGISGDANTLARNNASFFGSDQESSGWYSENGVINYNNSAQYTAATYTTGDIIQIAIDLDNNRLFYGKNGTWQNSGNPTTSTGAITLNGASACNDGAYFICQADDTGTSAVSKFEFNFGNGYFGTTAVSSAGTNASNNGIFEYDVPSGYTALSTKGLNL